MMIESRFLLVLLMLITSVAAWADDLRTPREADWIARDFRFHTGQTLPELRIHYTLVGNPTGEPVLILHGTAGSGTGMLAQSFAGELFGPGQPLDAATHFLILPDAMGAGKSSKPSDGLRAAFPEYDYDDMVQAQYRLVVEGLGLRRLRLILGNSMGGMHAWLWAVEYPGFADVVAPMASQPTEMAARNWMMRRMIIDAIRNDPDWNHGEYVAQPRGLKAALTFFGIATNGGTLAYQSLAPTHAAADKWVDDRLAEPVGADANDLLYQWNASRDYDASPGLEKIVATLIAINSADDERNPPETGIMDREIRRVKSGRYYLIPASAETRGHSTTMLAKFWKGQLAQTLATAPALP